VKKKKGSASPFPVGEKGAQKRRNPRPKATFKKKKGVRFLPFYATLQQGGEKGEIAGGRKKPGTSFSVSG